MGRQAYNGKLQQKWRTTIYINLKGLFLVLHVMMRYNYVIYKDWNEWSRHWKRVLGLVCNICTFSFFMLLKKYWSIWQYYKYFLMKIKNVNSITNRWKPWIVTIMLWGSILLCWRKNAVRTTIWLLLMATVALTIIMP